MIIFEGVTKTIGSGKTAKIFLRNVSVAIPTHLHIALLTSSLNEQSTFLKLVGQLSPPDIGHIHRDSHISFPVGSLDGFSQALSCRQNIAYLGRLYAKNTGALIKRVEKYSQLEARLDAPFATLTKKEKSLLASVVAFALPFEFYILPKFPVLVERDRGLARLFARRMRKAGMIVPVSRPTARKYCDVTLIIARGQLFFFDNIDEGFDVFQELRKASESNVS